MNMKAIYSCTEKDGRWHSIRSGGKRHGVMVLTIPEDDEVPKGWHNKVDDAVAAGESPKETKKPRGFKKKKSNV